MEHYYPDVFKGLQEKARTGKFDSPPRPLGVQMDENVVDGESWLYLHGQKYSKESSGHDVCFAWQTDVFGDPITMPQIAQKAALSFTYFNGLTTKHARPSSGGRA